MKLELSTALILLFVFLAVGGATLGSTLDAYAEVYFHNDSGVTFAVAAQDTYANFTGLTSGEIVGFNHSNGTLTSLSAGVFKIDYSVSFGGGGQDEYHVAVGVNAAEQDECHIARKLGNAGDVGNAGGSCLVTLAVGDEITLMYENENDADDMTVQDISLNVVRIA